LAAYFFDTSAVVKRYASEIGSAWVEQIADPALNPSLYLARVTEVEVASAITQRLRAGSLSSSDATIGMTNFHYDFLHQYRIVEILPALTSRAVFLVQAHGLRADDAVQLAAALEINADRVAVGLSAITLISADAALNAAAVVEGLAVDDPNEHP
jgi:predicted nucleic acid-binding protein